MFPFSFNLENYPEAQGLLCSTFYVPFYVILLAGTAMGLGTYFGGWRIVRTMGMKITKLHPFGGGRGRNPRASKHFPPPPPPNPLKPHPTNCRGGNGGWSSPQASRRKAGEG